MQELNETTEAFNFVGNRLCLDFTNTLHDRGTETERDHFSTYASLARWSEGAKILSAEEVQALLEEAKRHPEEAALVFRNATILREAIYRIFAALVREDSPEVADVQMLNTAYAQAMGRACVVQQGDTFTWDWQGKETALDRMLWDIVRSAAELLVSQDLSLIRECAAEDCSWLFLDSSKNHSRRWCEMKGCGNRAKVGRHYEKTQRKQI
ncbi:MAG: CGNR zinc finger domain-containing protein [Ktedonobacteraceae bacterium]|nr:CGNR zinc finger domain-containing protein [Ktedonobacteraceae bacterium]